MLLLAALSFWIATRHMSHSLWYDESITDLIARQDTLSDVAIAGARGHACPPLFFVVVHYALHFRNNEAGMRLPSAVFGALAIVAVFWLGQALADSLTGALAALLFFLTPGVFRYFVDGNAYTLLALLAALSTLFLIRAIRSDRISDWLGYALFAALGLAAHTFFAFYFVAQVLAGGYLRLSTRRVSSASLRRFLTVTGALCLVEVVWVVLFFHIGGGNRPVHFSRWLDFRTLVGIAAMYAGPLSVGYAVRLPLWVLLQSVGAAMFFIERRKAFWFVAILAALPLTAIVLFLRATMPFVAYKYGLGVFPLACILAAYSLKLRGARVVRACTFAAMASYLVAGAAFLATVNPTTFEFQDWKGPSRYLTERATDGDAIVLSSDYGVPCLGYYYKGPARLHGSGRGEEASIASRLLSEPGASDRAVWVVVLSLGNEDSLVARYTESGKRGLDAQTQIVLAALKEHGLSASVAARFHRVNVLLVRPA